MYLVNQVEREIFCRLVAGEALKEIAFNMNLHERCVAYYIAKVKGRLAAKNTVQAAVKLTLAGQLSE